MTPSEESAQAVSIHARTGVALGTRETVLALRLFALAVGCACGCLVESVVANAAPFTFGILAGAALALVQHRLLRVTPRYAGAVLLLPHLAIWTYLVVISGGPRSPLVAGYLLEVPLAGMLLGRAGALWAGSAAAAAIAIVSRASGSHTPWALVAAAIGFIGASCVLTCWLVAVVERQQLEIAASHERLRHRADTAADELRLLGDYMSGGLVTIDELGRVVNLNPAAADLLRTTLVGSQGRAWQEVMRPDAAACSELAAAITGAHGARQLRLLLAPDGGHPIAVAADLWTRETPQGARTYVLLDPVSDMAEGDPLRKLGEAAANVSHQIKNSLHALQGFAREISPGLPGHPKDADAAEQLHHALGTLGELAEDVLAMSGAPRGEEAVALQAVLASAVLLARRSGVQIVVRGGSSAPTRVRAHRGRLVHALFNLIDNACRATSAGSSIEVSLGACDDFAWVEICDRGAGIAAVRSPAHPPSASPVRASGHGLGLVATRRFLESFGARLEFLPREGGGSRCRVMLSRCDTVADAAWAGA